jgi:hypothetical protein
MAADLLGTADARIMLLENHGKPRAVHSLSCPPPPPRICWLEAGGDAGVTDTGGGGGAW